MLRFLLAVSLVMMGSCRLFDDISSVPEPRADSGMEDVASIVDAEPIAELDVNDSPEMGSQDMLTDEWWDPAFKSRVKIEFNTSATDQTVMIAIQDRGIDLATLQTASLRFVQDDALIPHDVERDDLQAVVAWVRIPDLSRPVFLYWGFPDALDGQNRSATWDQYTAVFHMDGPADVNDVVDGTTNERNVAFQAGDFGFEASMTDGFLVFPSRDNFDFDLENPILLAEAYLKPADPSDQTQYILWKEGSCIGWSLKLVGSLWRGTLGYAPTGCNDTTYVSLTGNAADIDQWVLISILYDLETNFFRIYRDGVLEVEKAMNYDGTSFTNRGARLAFGTDWQEIDGIDARYDEVRFSRNLPTQEYFDVQVRSYRNTLVSFGSVEVFDNGG